MKTALLSAAAILASWAAAYAQEPPLDDASFPDSAALEPAAAATKNYWTIGPRAGYVKPFDADEGTWFGGAQVRIYIGEHFALEGSIEFHRNEYSDGALAVTTFPVQVTGLLYPFKEAELKPYALGGIGWYYTTTDIDPPLVPASESQTDVLFGFHLGAGAELPLDEGMSLNADLRYIILSDPDFGGPANDDEFDSWQFTVGLNFKLSK
jgi:opacity protein-like surface antigen